MAVAHIDSAYFWTDCTCNIRYTFIIDNLDPQSICPKFHAVQIIQDKHREVSTTTDSQARQVNHQTKWRFGYEKSRLISSIYLFAQFLLSHKFTIELESIIVLFQKSNGSVAIWISRFTDFLHLLVKWQQNQEEKGVTCDALCTGKPQVMQS